MEVGIFTTWTFVHIFAGITLAFLFSLKDIRLIEFTGFLAIPLLFIGNPAVTLISLAVIFLSIVAFVVNRLEKKKKFTLLLDIILTLFLLILWEIAEYLTYPITHFGLESLVNKISDVVFGFCSFLVAYFILHRKHKKKIKSKRKSQ